MIRPALVSAAGRWALAVLLVVLPSCSSDGDDSEPSSGGNAGSGGSAGAGANSGGTNTGGTNSGGANTGGTNSGGTNTGGTNTGGANTGGANTGGANTGGANTGGTAGAPGAACPETPPAAGSACPVITSTCFYNDCDGGQRTIAICAESGWMVLMRPCSAFACAGGGQCTLDQVCSVVSGGAFIASCVAHECGTGLITCACANAGCSDCVLSDSGGGVMATCNTCPSGQCP